MASFYPHLYETALALLGKARVDARLTEQELARRFGQSAEFVSSYESGRRLLDPAEFIAICRTIGVSPTHCCGTRSKRPAALQEPKAKHSSTDGADRPESAHLRHS